MTVRIMIGDCRERLKELEIGSVHCCVCSPPYFGLRDYGVDGQMGLEPTPDEFVGGMVEVFREVRRVLRDDGTLWLNIGDSYGADKQLLGIPWRMAFALQRDGWIIRQEIVWHKPDPMPEGVRDRCTRAHELVFLIAKATQYYFDAAAISEPITDPSRAGKPMQMSSSRSEAMGRKPSGNETCQSKGVRPETRNKRSVWRVVSEPFRQARHFATYPPALIEPCILAGCPSGGTVLDPFGGAGTTGLVADRLQRDSILIELNPEYAELAHRRIARDGGMLTSVEIEA